MIAKTFRKALMPLAVAAALGAPRRPARRCSCSAGRTTPTSMRMAASRRRSLPANVACMHLTAGDGFITMADKSAAMPQGKSLYMFGFADVTTKPSNEIMLDSLAANFSAPTIALKQNQSFYLTLTNVAMAMRPDLFDPHTVHFHGFPQAGAGVRRHARGLVRREHGFVGHLLLQAERPRHLHVPLPPGGHRAHADGHARQPVRDAAQDGNTDALIRAASIVYNDGDGSTGYDVAYPLQLTSMDPVFHDASLSINPLPFKNMKDTYAMINGRGYPDTVNTDRPAAGAPREGRVRQQREFAADSCPDHRHPGPARPAAAVEPERHQLLHGDCTGPSDEGGRSGCAPAARAGRQDPVLRHHLGHARRRRVGGSVDRHQPGGSRGRTSSTPPT